MQHASTQIRQQLANITGTDPSDWFLVYRARFGMTVVLEAIAEKEGAGEVLTQPFTCSTAVNPIMSAGHVPVFSDTSPTTFSLDASLLQKTKATRAVFAQHTFGIEADMKNISAFTKKHSLTLIEDSAHKVGLIARIDGKPVADISIHSFGADKILPTRFGGAVWVNPDMKDSVLRRIIIERLETLPAMNLTTSLKARAYRLGNAFMNRVPSSRPILTALRLFEVPIAPEETQGKNHGRPVLPSHWMMKTIHIQLQSYKAIMKRRGQIVKLYRAAGFSPQIVTSDEPLVRFPIICSSREDAIRLFDSLSEKGFYAGKWYRPTLFPGVSDPALYNYDPKSCPVAEELSAKILNLPTNITIEAAKEVINVVRRQAI